MIPKTGNDFIAVGERLHHTKLRLYKELKSFLDWSLCGGRSFLTQYPPCNHCVCGLPCFSFHFSSLRVWISKNLGWRLCFSHHAGLWSSIAFLLLQLSNDAAHTIPRAVTCFFFFLFCFLLDTQLQWGSQDGYTQHCLFYFFFFFRTQDGTNRLPVMDGWMDG